MAKYMLIATLTAEGSKGLLKEGGSGRVEALKQLMGSVGGSVDAVYWGFGTDDFYAIVDAPSASAVAAASLAAAASGATKPRTIPLLTAEDLDAASQMAPQFRPPGA
jgi:uncharacterized protein with GYD domain